MTGQVLFARVRAVAALAVVAVALAMAARNNLFLVRGYSGYIANGDPAERFARNFGPWMPELRKEGHVGFVTTSYLWTLEPGATEPSRQCAIAQYILAPAIVIAPAFDGVPRDLRVAHVQKLLNEPLWRELRWLLFDAQANPEGDAVKRLLAARGYRPVGTRVDGLVLMKRDA